MWSGRQSRNVCPRRTTTHLHSEQRKPSWRKAQTLVDTLHDPVMYYSHGAGWTIILNTNYGSPFVRMDIFCSDTESIIFKWSAGAVHAVLAQTQLSPLSQWHRLLLDERLIASPPGVTGTTAICFPALSSVSSPNDSSGKQDRLPAVKRAFTLLTLFRYFVFLSPTQIILLYI